MTARSWSASEVATRRARRSCSSGTPLPCFGLRAGCCPTGATPEEVTQEVFVKVITRAHQYDGRAEVSSWLFAIAANACRDRRRRDRRGPVIPIDAMPEPAARGEGVEGTLIEREKRDAVRRALAQLSEEQREALVLARYHGLPYAEIAEILGISVGAVKTRIFRAVETLKGHFSEGATSWNAAN